MRLHSLVIPFSLGIPFLGLASHDKITRFCADIEHPEWCVDINEPDFGERLLHEAYSPPSPDECSADMKRVQTEQWELSQNNLDTIFECINMPVLA
jgi:polysaccharide pyruvyl transferase WcaK-like protein